MNSSDPMIRDSALRFCEREKDLKKLRARRNCLPGNDPLTAHLMAKAGWFGALIPESYGGLGTSFTDMAAIVEELGKGLLAEQLVATAVLGARALLHCDNEALKQRLLPAVAAGELTIALAWQERGSSIDPESIVTSAERVAGGYRLTGRKRFVVGVGVAGYLVSARSAGKVILIWVDANAPGLSITHEWRADGTPASVLVFEDIKLIDADLAASPGEALSVLDRALDEATVMVAAEALGVMSAAFEITLEYLRTRVQFGRPIGSFQVLQHRAADLYLHRELAAASVAAAVRTLDETEVTSQRRLAASRAKFRCAEAGMRIARVSIQLHGAMGFTDECDIGLYLKRAMVLCAWLGNGDLHKARVKALDPATLVKSDADITATDTSRALFAAEMTRAVADRNWNEIGDDAFREIAALFFRENLPPALRFLPRRPNWEEVKPWYFALGSNSWLAPAWPQQYGGMGLNPAKLMIYHEEMGRSGAPRHLEQGINYIGPLLISRGSEAQKAKYLPKILTGENLWCQGYSEPSAGSDLASLRTRAIEDETGFTINGQKIWTTMAQFATHMYALVRTDPSSERHAGISMLLIDMKTPGITVRPILNIAGYEEFCEVFLEAVRTPSDSLVGELNQGWQVSRTLLGFERNTVGSPRTCLAALERIEIAAHELPEAELAVFADRLTEGWLDVADLASMYERFVQTVRTGVNPSFEVSVMKIWATETQQRLTELLVDMLGDSGTIAGPQNLGGIAVDVLSPFLDSRSTTISAGSSQIQRNVLAKRVLKL